MERNSFIFYRSFYDAIKDLPRDIQGDVYTAIMEYSLNGITTDNLKPIAKSIFTLIKPQLDANIQRYNNGKKGGRPSKEETEQKPNNNLAVTKPKPNKNVNDNVNDNNNSSNKLLLSETSQPHAESINYTELVEWFNKTTKGVFGLIRLPLSEKRKGMIRARIREHGKDVFCEAIIKASESDFLKGGNAKGFKADFDWLIKPTNFEKVISGNYVNRNRSNRAATSGTDDDFARSIAEGISRGYNE